MTGLRIIGIVGMTILFLQGCSFLYGEPEQNEPDSVVDISGIEEPWHVEDFSAVNHNGEEWSTSDLQGQWWVAKTIFTRCPTVCMTMTPNMVELQEGILDNHLDVQIVSFTVDPEFDSPERLADYGESYGADFDNWNFVTGYTQEEVEEFALASFKAPVSKIPEQNDIAHPTRFFLVNPEGVVVKMYNGDAGFNFEESIDDLINTVQ